jgi:hypothetical protein
MKRRPCFSRLRTILLLLQRIILFNHLQKAVVVAPLLSIEDPLKAQYSIEEINYWGVSSKNYGISANYIYNSAPY